METVKKKSHIVKSLIKRAKTRIAVHEKTFRTDSIYCVGSGLLPAALRCEKELCLKESISLYVYPGHIYKNLHEGHGIVLVLGIGVGQVLKSDMTMQVYPWDNSTIWNTLLSTLLYCVQCAHRIYTEPLKFDDLY